MKERKQAQFAEEAGYYASVRIPDIAQPKNEEEERRKQAIYVKGFLHEQIEQKKRAKKDGEGKFFGMTDEEIL